MVDMIHLSATKNHSGHWWLLDLCQPKGLYVDKRWDLIIRWVYVA